MGKLAVKFAVDRPLGSCHPEYMERIGFQERYFKSEIRMVVKSILAKIRNKFQVSAVEVPDQDIHQSIVIGVASIVPHSVQADSVMDEIISFFEQNTEAEIVAEEREIR